MEAEFTTGAPNENHVIDRVTPLHTSTQAPAQERRKRLKELNHLRLEAAGT